jgi:thymidine phosphorylase
VAIGNDAGRRTRALVTDMNTPLGSGIGNGLEVIEVVETLRTAPEGRFAEVCLALATTGLAAATGIDPADARDRLVGVWESGAALETLQRMIEAQGGDPAVCDRPREVMPVAPVVLDVPSPTSGLVTRLPAKAVGLLSMSLGAGRQHANDDVDPAVGVELLVQEGDAVEAGQPLATIHARTDDAAAAAAARLTELVQLGEDAAVPPTILRTIEA